MSNIFSECYNDFQDQQQEKSNNNDIEKFFAKGDFYNTSTNYNSEEDQGLYKQSYFGIKLPSYSDLGNMDQGDLFFPQTPMSVDIFFNEENQGLNLSSDKQIVNDANEDVYEAKIDFSKEMTVIIEQEQQQQNQEQEIDFQKMEMNVPMIQKKSKISKKKTQESAKDIFKTKNIPKVFGNAFRMYVSSNVQHVTAVCAKYQVSIKDFNSYVKKLNFYSIKGMREAFQPQESDPKQDQFRTIYRILVNKFLREDTWTWFLSNKRIANCRRLCNFRFYILRGLKYPSAFVSWED